MNRNRHTHENKHRASETAAAIAALFLIISLNASGTFARALTIAALSILILSLFTVRPIAPLVPAWESLGKLLGRIVTPVILAVLFYAILTPVALVHRIFRRDALKLKRQSESIFVSTNKTFTSEDMLRPF